MYLCGEYQLHSLPTHHSPRLPLGGDDVARAEDGVELEDVLWDMVGGDDGGVGGVVEGGRVGDGAGDDEADVGPWLAQDGGDLLRPHAAHVHVPYLQDVVSAVQSTVLRAVQAMPHLSV